MQCIRDQTRRQAQETRAEGGIAEGHSRDGVPFHTAGPEAGLSGEGIQELLGAHVLGSVVTMGTEEAASSAIH